MLINILIYYIIFFVLEIAISKFPFALYSNFMMTQSRHWDSRPEVEPVIYIYMINPLSVFQYYMISYYYKLLVITPSIPNYKTLWTNSCPFRKVINLVDNIKYVNYLYYHYKIILSYLLSICFSLMFGDRIIT